MNYAMLNWFNTTFKAEKHPIATGAISIQETYMLIWIFIYFGLMLTWLFGGLIRGVKWTRVNKVKAHFKAKMRIKPKRKDFTTEKQGKCTIFHVKKFQPQE